jgi:hypothetical protein
MACYQKWSLIITGIGILVGIGVLIVYAFQLSEMRKTSEATRDSVEAAKQAANAAMAGQRAYLSDTAYWAFDDANPPNANFGVSWANVGNMPTKKMRNYIDYKLLKGELPSDFKFPDDAAPIVSGTLLLPKQQPILGPRIPKDGHIRNSDLLAIQREEISLYIFGWAKYFDGFPNTPERVTKFCYQVVATGNRQQPFVFRPYRLYNCADEGCDEDK